MEYLCPLCNGLAEFNRYCRNCKNNMEDSGRVQDYYDDYSPYLSYSITNVMDGEPQDVCQHLFTCPVCGNDDVVNISKKYF